MYIVGVYIKVVYVMYAAEMQNSQVNQITIDCGSSVYVTQPHKIITYFSSYSGGEVSG